MATRLNIADALEAEVLKGHPLAVKEIKSIVNNSSKPPTKVYDIIKKLANPETPNDMIRRIGIKHLFDEKLLSDHPEWEKRLLRGIDEIAVFAKKSRNRFGAMQLLRFFRNAFISPARIISASFQDRRLTRGTFLVARTLRSSYAHLCRHMFPRKSLLGFLTRITMFFFGFFWLSRGWKDLTNCLSWMYSATLRIFSMRATTIPNSLLKKF